MDVPGVPVYCRVFAMQCISMWEKLFSFATKLNGFRSGERPLTGLRVHVQLIVNITTLRTKTRTMEWRGTNGCLL